MREIMRSLLSSNLLVTGIIMFIGSLITFAGSTFLLNATNVGKRLGFLITGAAIFGWGVINSIFFILYAPRGPAPANIDGLNAFEIRIIPLTFLVGSGILFVMFLLALNRFEQEQLEKEDQDKYIVFMTQIWFIAAAVLLLAELLVPTFFILPFAIGSFFAGVSSLFTESQNIQLSTFVVFSLVGVYLSVKVFGPKNKEMKTITSFTEGANKYIGMTFVTTEELDMYEPTLQHVYGDDWQVVSLDQRIPPGSKVKVINVNGTKLEVQTKEG